MNTDRNLNFSCASLIVRGCFDLVLLVFCLLVYFVAFAFVFVVLVSLNTQRTRTLFWCSTNVHNIYLCSFYLSHSLSTSSLSVSSTSSRGSISASSRGSLSASSRGSLNSINHYADTNDHTLTGYLTTCPPIYESHVLSTKAETTEGLANISNGYHSPYMAHGSRGDISSISPPNIESPQGASPNRNVSNTNLNFSVRLFIIVSFEFKLILICHS